LFLSTCSSCKYLQLWSSNLLVAHEIHRIFSVFSGETPFNPCASSVVMGRDYRKLEIWQKAYQLVLKVYPLLAQLPPLEQNNIGDQARRASSSIPLNIAEGCSSRSNKVFLNHLNYAYASGKELEVVMMLARDLGYLQDVSEVLELIDVVKKMCYGLMRSVEKEVGKGMMNFTASDHKSMF